MLIYCGLLLGNFWNNLGYCLIQHLVTLVDVDDDGIDLRFRVCVTLVQISSKNIFAKV